MEKFMAIVLIVSMLAFSVLFIAACVVGTYFLFNLMA